MWQKCPMCNGTGSDPSWLVHNGNIPKCPVCKGERIINELTGKPPKSNKTETLKSSNIDNFTYLKEFNKNHSINTKKPILRGCKNRQCFCTGKCREIIGYEENYVEISNLKKSSNIDSKKVINTEPVSHNFPF